MQALPAWNALMLAKRPVALSVPDCAQVKALALQARVRHSITCRLPSPFVMQLGAYLLAANRSLDTVDLHRPSKRSLSPCLAANNLQ